MRPREDQVRIEQIREKYRQEAEQRCEEIHQKQWDTWRKKRSALEEEADRQYGAKSAAERGAAIAAAVILGLGALFVLVIVLYLLLNLLRLAQALVTGTVRWFITPGLVVSVVGLAVFLPAALVLIRRFERWDDVRERQYQETRTRLEALRRQLVLEEQEKREEVYGETQATAAAAVDAYRRHIHQLAAAYDQMVQQAYQELRSREDLQEIYSFAFHQIDRLVQLRRQQNTGEEPFLQCSLICTVERWGIRYTSESADEYARLGRVGVRYDFSCGRFAPLESEQRGDALAMVLRERLCAHVEKHFERSQVSVDSRRKGSEVTVTVLLPNRRFRATRTI